MERKYYYWIHVNSSSPYAKDILEELGVPSEILKKEIFETPDPVSMRKGSKIVFKDSETGEKLYTVFENFSKTIDLKNNTEETSIILKISSSVGHVEPKNFNLFCQRHGFERFLTKVNNGKVE